MMFFGALRFYLNGWVESQYIDPVFHFKYYGFQWVEVLPDTYLYLAYGLMMLSALGIAFGALYRLSSVFFFVIFTYFELIDLTYYLNHYYFVSLVAFILIFLPANRAYSIDTLLFQNGKSWLNVPAWTINILKFQLAIVYIYAGIAKVNPDWLIHAMPLKIWLKAHSEIPVFGPLLFQDWVAYAFSWAGCFFDLFVVFFLLNSRTRLFAYIALVSFHLVTGFLFPIGMFPYIMIALTLIFFSSSFHKKLLSFLPKPGISIIPEKRWFLGPKRLSFLFLFVAFQIIFPWRFLAYPGKLFWNEEGFRFGWRVMLIEKAGYATFYISNPETGEEEIVQNCDYLNPYQEKMMATQPDLLLQFAHFLEEEYKMKYDWEDPVVRVESYVSLQGEGSRLFVDPQVDLSEVEYSLKHFDWLIPYKDI